MEVVTISESAQQLRDIETTTLPNGVRVITERMDHVRSVSLGVWIRTGSRRETPEENGISHFIEHMVFKGTRNRSAEDIARSVDSIGGGLDAFTAKEMVSYNTKVLDEHLPLAFDVLADLVLNPLFREEDIEKEKGVILEELKMEVDNPEYLLHEIFSSNFWKDHPLGKPILGTKDTVQEVRPRDDPRVLPPLLLAFEHPDHGGRQSETRAPGGPGARSTSRGLRVNGPHCSRSRRRFRTRGWFSGTKPRWNRPICTWACRPIRFRTSCVSPATR